MLIERRLPSPLHMGLLLLVLGPALAACNQTDGFTEEQWDFVSGCMNELRDLAGRHADRLRGMDDDELSEIIDDAQRASADQTNVFVDSQSVLRTGRGNTPGGIWGVSMLSPEP